MPPVKKRTSSQAAKKSSNRWILAGLATLLVAAAAFAAWAYVASRSVEEPVVVVEEPPPPPPPPPPPKYYCPLDGTLAADLGTTLKRPIIVQIDNAPAARPQSGLSQAEMVYEATAEGDITRYSAIFICREVKVVGPVRSARLINLELVPQYQALLANSGSSAGVTAAIDAEPDIPNISDPAFGEAVYYRDYNRIAPHNLMTGTEAIRQAALTVGHAGQANLSGLLFKDDSPAAAPLKSISVPYSGYANVSYNYDARANNWQRFIGGEADIDELNGSQIAPKNVIIQYVDVYPSDIEEDVGGAVGLIYELTGSGKVQIFRDGQIINGLWKRSTSGSLTTYVDSGGQPIPLNRGQSWVQIVPTDFVASWE